MNSYAPPCPRVERSVTESPKPGSRRNCRCEDTGNSLPVSRVATPRARAAGICLDKSAV